MPVTSKGARKSSLKNSKGTVATISKGNDDKKFKSSNNKRGSPTRPDGKLGSSGKKKKTSSVASAMATPVPSKVGSTSSVNNAILNQPSTAKKTKSRSPPSSTKTQKVVASVATVKAAADGNNDAAAALAAAILRGVTMRPSGKWQAQLYFAGKSRYIGVFDSREKAALAYEIAREKLKNGETSAAQDKTSTENLVNAARKAAFEGVSNSQI